MRICWKLAAAVAALVAAGGCDWDPSGPGPRVQVEITTTDSLLRPGQLLLMEATVKKSDGKPVAVPAISWSSSDTTVATVNSSGLLAAVSRGPVLIVARSGSAADTAALRVVKEVRAEIRAKPFMVVGSTQRISVSAQDAYTMEYVPDPQVVLRSSDTTVVSVVDSTEVRAVGVGTATITLRVEARLATVQITVVPGYGVTALPTLGGAAGRGLGINGRGDVVGEAQTASGEWHAFLYRDGKITDVGPAGVRSRAVAVNSDGTVVGNLFTGPDTTTGIRPFRWKSGTAEPLAVPGDPLNAYATDINDQGSAVGYTASPGPGCTLHCSPTTGRAVLWEGTRMTDLGTLGGVQASALAIDDQGRIGGGVDYPPRYGVVIVAGEVQQVVSVPWFVADGGGYFFGLTTANHGWPEVIAWKDGALERFDVGHRRDVVRVRGANRLGEVVMDVTSSITVGPTSIRVLDSKRRVLEVTSLLAPGTPWEVLGSGGIDDSGRIVGWGRHTTTGEIRAILISPL